MNIHLMNREYNVKPTVEKHGPTYAVEYEQAEYEEFFTVAQRKLLDAGKTIAREADSGGWVTLTVRMDVLAKKALDF